MHWDEVTLQSFNKPALNAWLLSLSIIRKRGLLVKGIRSPGKRTFEPVPQTQDRKLGLEKKIKTIYMG